MNLIQINGSIAKIDTLRYTPTGLPVLSFELWHRSEIEQEKSKRSVELLIMVLAVGEVAKTLMAMTQNRDITTMNIVVKGFLVKKSLKSKQVVINAQSVESHA